MIKSLKLSLRLVSIIQLALLPHFAVADCDQTGSDAQPLSAENLGTIATSDHAVIKAIEKGFEDSLSVGVGVTHVQSFESSIWWQEGLSNKRVLNSPSADLQFNLKADSIGPLANLNSKILHHLSANAGIYYGGSYSVDAEATMTGYDNPKRSPVFQWTGHGETEGAYLTLQYDLPKGYYVALGPTYYKNKWELTVHQAKDCPRGISCPKIGPDTVHDTTSANRGGRFTLGKHITENGGIEFNVYNDSDNGWAPDGIPPIWHNQAYNLEWRQGFR